MFNLKSCELPLTYKWYWIVLDVIHTITWFSNKRGGMTAKKVKKARSVFVQINRTEQKKACCWPGKHICLQYCRRGFAKGFPFLYRAHSIQNINLTLRIQIFFHITCCLFWSFDYQNSDDIFNHRLFLKKCIICSSLKLIFEKEEKMIHYFRIGWFIFIWKSQLKY